MTLDLSGMRFGKLVALNSAKEPGGKLKWVCRCDCGNRVYVVTSNLRSGNSKSCGCLRGEDLGAFSIRSPEYRAYRNAKNRCERKADVRYANYGGRGIKFKFESFAEFIDALGGKRPTKQHSLDRVDSDGHYEVGNVRWATNAEQVLNKTSNKMVEIDGVEKPLVKWAREFGVPYKKAHERIHSLNWSPKEALGITKRPVARTVITVEQLP